MAILYGDESTKKNLCPNFQIPPKNNRECFSLPVCVPLLFSLCLEEEEKKSTNDIEWKEKEKENEKEYNDIPCLIEKKQKKGRKNELVTISFDGAALHWALIIKLESIIE